MPPELVIIASANSGFSMFTAHDPRTHCWGAGCCFYIQPVWPSFILACTPFLPSSHTSPSSWLCKSFWGDIQIYDHISQDTHVDLLYTHLVKWSVFKPYPNLGAQIVPKMVSSLLKSHWFLQCKNTKNSSSESGPYVCAAHQQILIICSSNNCTECVSCLTPTTTFQLSVISS